MGTERKRWLDPLCHVCASASSTQRRSRLDGRIFAVAPGFRVPGRASRSGCPEFQCSHPGAGFQVARPSPRRRRWSRCRATCPVAPQPARMEPGGDGRHPGADVRSIIRMTHQDSAVAPEQHERYGLRQINRGLEAREHLQRHRGKHHAKELAIGCRNAAGGEDRPGKRRPADERLADEQVRIILDSEMGHVVPV